MRLRNLVWMGFGFCLSSLAHSARGQEAVEQMEPRSSINLSVRKPGETDVARAAGREAAKDKKPGDWEFELSPYLWASSLRTVVEAGPISIDNNVCFTDLLQALDMGAMMRLEGRRDRWGFYVEGLYLSLSDDGRAKIGPFRIRGLETEVRFTQAELDFGGMYRFGERGRNFDLLFGGRYTHLETDVSVGPFSGSQNNIDYVTPVVGGRFLYEMSDKWLFSFKADAGGFSIGDAPDFAWGATAILGYRLNECTTLGLGYRIYDAQDSGDRKDVDIQYHGPMLGVAFSF